MQTIENRYRLFVNADGIAEGADFEDFRKGSPKGTVCRTFAPDDAPVFGFDSVANMIAFIKLNDIPVEMIGAPDKWENVLSNNMKLIKDEEDYYKETGRDRTGKIPESEKKRLRPDLFTDKIEEQPVGEIRTR